MKLIKEGKNKVKKIQESIAVTEKHIAEGKFHNVEKKIAFLRKKLKESQKAEWTLQEVFDKEKKKRAKAFRDNYLGAKIDVSPLTHRLQIAEGKLTAQKEVSNLIREDIVKQTKALPQLELNFLNVEISELDKKLKKLNDEFLEKKGEQEILRHKATKIKDKLDGDYRRKRILEQS